MNLAKTSIGDAKRDMSRGGAPSLVGMSELKRLKARMLDLGLSLSTWDAGGKLIGELEPGCEYCRAMSRGGGPCIRAEGEVAQQVIATGQSVQMRTRFGCCLMGVPVHQRRRLLGAVVAAYPAVGSGDEKSLNSLYEQLRMDGSEMKRLAAQSCRHSAPESESLLRILTWMVEQEQALNVAHDEIATLSVNLANTYEELSLVYRISGETKVTQDPRTFVQNVCKELAEVMNVEGVVALTRPHPSSGAAQEEAVVAGEMDLNIPQIRMLASAHIGPRVAQDNKAILDNCFEAGRESGLGGAVRNFIAAGLAGDRGSNGLLIALNKRSGDFDSVDLKLLGSIANQTSVFMANSHLYADLQDLLMGVLHALTASIDAKDPYTCGHSQRVALVSRRLAEECGFGPEKVQQIYMMGLLHDIGKIGVPESVLSKAGRLTEEEFELIKRHPAVGANILGSIRQLDGIVMGILTHHERPDGKGYPHKLKGDELPMEGMIVGLADCFDAMTSNRTYREALPLDTVITEIRNHAGTQFHAGLVKKFLALDLRKFLEEIHQPPPSVMPAVAQSIRDAMMPVSIEKLAAPQPNRGQEEAQ